MAGGPRYGGISSVSPPESEITMDSVSDYSLSTLERTPERALRLLRAVGTNAPIRDQLMRVGFDAADHTEGWELIHKASGFSAQSLAVVDDGSVRRAIVALDDWDERGMRLAAAALRRRHPEQYEVVFDGVEPERGVAAVLGVARFLDRLDALEAGTDEDRAALAALATRGIDTAERARLRDLITAAESAPEIVGPSAEERADAHEAQLASLRALRAWYDEWADTARAVIKRRDHLISLGLASRRRRNAGEAAEEVVFGEATD